MTSHTPLAKDGRDEGKPVRIQRQRTKGWKKPNNTTCVTRGTLWGNPFIVRPDLCAGEKVGRQYFAVPTIEDAVATYRDFMNERPDLIEKARRNLRGKNLACFCRLDQPCHADVLLELANSPTQRGET
jgi:hypothetical protein